jgi:exodeoxyribonuclease V
MKYTLSADQAEALKRIGTWYKGKETPFLTLGGYAGTGKTTMIAYLRQALRQHDEHSRVAFCAFTGKATRVLDQKLREQKVPRKGDNVSTIHALIYMAELDTHGTVKSWRKKDGLDFDLIVVDEASMVDEKIWQDLLSFEIPILAVGDHGQLPPVGSSFNLMADPQVRLERIFRQDAQSPIVEVATMARLNGHIPVGEYGPGVKKLDRGSSETGQIVQELLENYRSDLMILCGYNKTRVNLNQAVRSYMGYETFDPSPGDRVVCLRNNRKTKIYNGMTGSIKHLDSAGDKDDLWYEVAIELDNEDYAYEGHILKSQFGSLETEKQLPKSPDFISGDLFDFGYALTVHKAQGSQAQKVLLFEERFPRMTDEDWRRWLYTGVTRAVEELIIVGS